VTVRAWAGKYDQRVSVCKNEPTTNTDGQKVASETVWIQRWASVEPISGRERLIAQQTQADVTYRVRVRYDRQTKTITPTYHLKLRDGTVLNITRAFDVEMRKTEIEMECTQRV
jgi:SPP1 family predicted phage head-tail adaptor